MKIDLNKLESLGYYVEYSASDNTLTIDYCPTQDPSYIERDYMTYLSNCGLSDRTIERIQDYIQRQYDITNLLTVIATEETPHADF